MESLSLESDPEVEASEPIKSEPIKYRIEYYNASSGQSASFTGKEKTVGAEVEPPVLEFVDVRLTNEALGQKENREKRPHEVARGHSYMKVLSPAVCEALRCVVDYLPNDSLSKESIQIWEPFQVFVFFEKELTEYRERLERSDTSNRESLCTNRFAAKHIKIAQDFVQQRVGADVEAERKRHARGYATFDMLWLLYKWGTDVYVVNAIEKDHRPFVVKDISFSLQDETTDVYRFTLWNMNANSALVGPSQIFEREYRFAGEKEITSLFVFPCDYLHFLKGVSKQDALDIKNYLIDRGKKWYSMRRKKNYYSFDGTNTSHPKRSVGQINHVDIIARQGAK